MTKKHQILGVAIMVKNEKKRILVTLESCYKYADCMIILDTGSTDNTKELITTFCKEHNLKLYLKEEPFVDFSTSRNVLLDFADDKADYLIQLDCNDEIQGFENLRKFVDEYDGIASGFQVCQTWFNGQSVDKYYNVRLIKTKHNWRYHGVVHEYIISPEVEKNLSNIPRLSPNFVLYQDRTQDDDKTSKRFLRDKTLLYNEYKKNPHDPRTLFYLGQTCACLHDSEEAYKYYKLRIPEGNFTEEVFQSYLRCGELSEVLGFSWEESQTWYIKAIEYSETIFKHPRVEPLVKLAEYYYKKERWHMAYMYIRQSIDIPYPEDAVLFVNKLMYDYTRFHIMGIVGYYVDQKELGKISCMKAIDYKIKNVRSYVPVKSREHSSGIDPAKSLDLEKDEEYIVNIGNLKFYVSNEVERISIINKLKKLGIEGFIKSQGDFECVKDNIIKSQGDFEFIKDKFIKSKDRSNNEKKCEIQEDKKTVRNKELKFDLPFSVIYKDYLNPEMVNITTRNRGGPITMDMKQILKDPIILDFNGLIKYIDGTLDFNLERQKVFNLEIINNKLVYVNKVDYFNVTHVNSEIECKESKPDLKHEQMTTTASVPERIQKVNNEIRRINTVKLEIQDIFENLNKNSRHTSHIVDKHFIIPYRELVNTNMAKKKKKVLKSFIAVVDNINKNKVDINKTLIKKIKDRIQLQLDMYLLYLDNTLKNINASPNPVHDGYFLEDIVSDFAVDLEVKKERHLYIKDSNLLAFVKTDTGYYNCPYYHLKKSSGDWSLDFCHTTNKFKCWLQPEKVNLELVRLVSAFTLVSSI